MGIGDVVTAKYSGHFGHGIIVDYDANRSAPLRVLFDDDYDDWFAEQELVEHKRPTLELGTAA